MDRIKLSNTRGKDRIVQRFRVSDALWEKLSPHLPSKRGTGKLGGRPAKSCRVVLDAIFCVLRTGCQWKSLTVASHGISGSAAHDWFQFWISQGVFLKLWQNGLLSYEELVGVDWTWQAMDGGMSKAPLGVRPSGRIRQIGRNWESSAQFTPTAVVSLSDYV